jgi:RNA polymerase sigma-70 factor (ECF subfamily)
MNALTAQPGSADRARGHAKVARTLDEGRPDGEAWLAAIAAGGDRAAFRSLFAWFAPRVKAQLLSAGADAASADELVQEVMLRVWRGAAQFDPRRGAASTWIHAIARNTLVNHRRGGRSLESQQDRETELDLDLHVEEGGRANATPEAAALDMERRRALDAALGALPPEQVEILRGAYFSGRTLRDLAEERRLPLGTVKTRARLALERLRSMLKGTWET